MECVRDLICLIFYQSFRKRIDISADIPAKRCQNLLLHLHKFRSPMDCKHWRQASASHYTNEESLGELAEQ